MLKLRLSRGGTKKRPVYKVVVADSRFARDGRFIEKVGFFNPLLPKEKKERVGLEAERIKYWLGQGAKPTTRVARILGENELMPMPANGNNPIKAVPKKERNKKEEDNKEAPKEESPILISSIFLVESILSSTPSKWPQIKDRDFSLASSFAKFWSNFFPFGDKYKILSLSFLFSSKDFARTSAFNKKYWGN